MIKFIEDNHQYVDLLDGSTDWTSVTTLIHKFEPKKDWGEIRRKYAKKHGLSEEEVAIRWSNENIKAVNRGTKFHAQREAELLSCETITIEDKPLFICRPIIDNNGHKIAPNQKLSDGIYPELMVAMKSAKICGQADYVEIINGRINIKDYKTNKELKWNGFINWEGIEEMMTGPLSHIPNCNGWLYALQLNTYAYIIRKNNPTLKLGKLELLHIRFDEYDEVSEVIPHVLPDLQSSVHNMIEYYKTNKHNL
jgi:hypothetical protein